jgi:CDP-diacylglycerol--glycerol-3-phosphate 3-phosphatidyltransferase
MAQRSIWREIYTPANIATTVRILLVPVFLVLILAPWERAIADPLLASQIKPWVAALFYVLLACTDTLDGYLARSRNEVTTLGKFLDPLADKILVAAALLALVQLGSLPAWIALIILAREFLISGLRMIAAAEGRVIAASKLGKAKTIFQIIAVTSFMVKDSLASLWSSNAVWGYFINALAWLMMAVALVLTVASMIDYFYKNRGVFGFGEKQDGEQDKEPSPVLSELAASVEQLARARGYKVGCAESCTGGLVAAALTDIAGSSDVFMGGIVSYDNAVKMGELGVTSAVLETDGAVSESCVRQMVEGARRVLQVDCAVATSGIAGPGGGTPEKPVGTVWFGLATPENTSAWLRNFDGDRAQVRVQATQAALEYLHQALR